jgi:hypothetical protein
MNRIKVQQKGNKKIPESATEVTRHDYISVCFIHLSDTVASLSSVSREWMEQMIRQFKVLGSISWNDITKMKGLGWDQVPQHSMKYTIPPSLGRTHLNHIKISGKSRIWGFREGNSFHIVWLDPEHKVTPE